MRSRRETSQRPKIWMQISGQDKAVMGWVNESKNQSTTLFRVTPMMESLLKTEIGLISDGLNSFLKGLSGRRMTSKAMMNLAQNQSEGYKKRFYNFVQNMTSIENTDLLTQMCLLFWEQYEVGNTLNAICKRGVK